MNKDIDQLHIDLLYEKDTDEPNGVEVKVPFTPYLTLEDWKCLCYIKNIYIEDKRKYSDANQRSMVPAFNNRKVYTYNTFKLLQCDYPFTNTIFSSINVLIGNIPYKVDYNSLWDDDIHYSWESTFKFICPFINIGEVDITPNREALLYSERTKTTLRKAYNAAIEELTQLWEDDCNTKKENFKDFVSSIKNHHFNDIILPPDISIKLSNNLPYKVEYKDFSSYDYRLLKNIIHTFLYYRTENVIAHLNDGELRRGRTTINWNIEKILYYCENEEAVVIAVPNSNGFSSRYIKGFLEKQYPNKDVFLIKSLHISNSKIKHFIKDVFGISTFSNSNEVHLIIKCIRELFEYISEHAIVKDIINSPEYKQYKIDNKEKKSYVRSNITMPFHIWSPSSSDYSKTTITDTPENIIQRLKRRYPRTRIVYASLDNVLIHGFQALNYPNLVIVGLSQNNLKLANNGMFPNWVRPIEELYNKNNRVLQRMAALKYIRENTIISELPTAVPDIFRLLSRKLVAFAGKYIKGRYELDFEEAQAILDIVPKELYDKEIMALYHQVKPYLYIVNKATSTTLFNHFGWYFLMKAKKVRLSYAYYKCIKDEINDIINLL